MKPIQKGETVIEKRWNAVAVSLAFVIPSLGEPAAVRAQHSTHPTHPPMSDTRFFLRVERVTPDGTHHKEILLTQNPTNVEGDLNQTVDWTEGQSTLRLMRYLAQANLEQTAAPFEGESAKPAVELAIEGPTQSVKRWLIADDPARNRLTSYIGTWRFMSVRGVAERDELKRQFETELVRDPQLLISRSNGEQEQRRPLRVDSTQAIENLGCTVRVLRFFPDYSMDRDKPGGGGEPVNRSQKRLNPAAEVEITKDGKTEKRWVFAKFPGFGPKDWEQIPIRLNLDCPVESSGTTPDYVLVSVAGKELERWARFSGKTTFAPLAPRESVEISGSQYMFQVASFLPSARLIEEYKPSEPNKGVAALQVEVLDRSGGSSQVWLALGESKTVVSSSGPISLFFHSDSANQHGGHP